MSTTTRWNKQRWMAVGAVAVAATMVLSACGGDNNDSGKKETNLSLGGLPPQINAQPRDNIQDGGKYTTALPEISPQFNPFQADGTLYTSNVWRWYNPVLINFAPDGKTEVDADYLTGYDKSLVDGKTVLTYTINPKATFNDGTPIDWTAFKTTWETNNGKNEAYSASSTDGYSRIVSVVQGKDAKQAIVTFDGVYAWPDGLFNFVLHPKAASPDFYNKGYVDTPHNELGAGPYQIKSYDSKGGTIVFERNPKWWGNKGKLDERIYRVLQDQAEINAFKAGEIDAVGVSSKENLAKVQGMTNIDIRKSSTPSIALLTLNTESPVLKDVAVRKAILDATDRSTIARVRFQGLNYTEELPGSFNLYPFQPGYEDNVKGVIDFNTGEANKTLDEAGWKRGSDGIREKDGKKLELSMPNFSDSQTIAAVLQAFQSMQRAIGVKINIVPKTGPSDFSDVMSKKSFDVLFSGFSASDPFGYAYFCQVYCSDSTLNKSGAGTKEFDAKIKAVGNIADPAKQIAEGNKLERELIGTYSIVPLYNGPTQLAVKKGLANVGAGQFYTAQVENIGYQK
ncbi:ABC transporter family substrate-binding protein [Williamsia sp. CHRR-6]|uniref:ABC transporter family substrate-binding protein n=1 Tax=Williamsia sp. CHRR-6 TaxID=2835871 RepID=UPI001BDAEF8F|nr:ABC transporter family substrate-binding protein [Williamsia sp. CHRR-6]MBT0566833.1 ABC transporter family substrate-binding protein [Williamsia sp. CHRR-6]